MLCLLREGQEGHSIQKTKRHDTLFGPISAIFNMAEKLNKTCFDERLSSHWILSWGTKEERRCCRSTVNAKTKTRATNWDSWENNLQVFSVVYWKEMTKSLWTPTVEPVWSNDSGADILLASHWSNLQSDWFHLMLTCPAEIHRWRHTLSSLSDSSFKLTLCTAMTW